MYKRQGKGIVTGDYIFDDSRQEYKNIRTVKWLQISEWEHPGKSVAKRLTDITPYTDYIEKLITIFTPDELDDVDTDVYKRQPLTFPELDVHPCNFAESEWPPSSQCVLSCSHGALRLPCLLYTSPP